MKAVWQLEREHGVKRALDHNLSTDAVVIGAGLAGILTAYELKKKGLDVVVLEANTVGSGVSQYTTAKITSQHGLIYHNLIKRIGFDLAKQYADANQAAVKHYKQLVAEGFIDCDFEEVNAYVYSLNETDSIKAEVKAACSLGIDAKYTTETGLPFPIKGAVCFSGQAQFHPLKFIRHLAQQLDIYENTPVEEIGENLVKTTHAKVQAKHIIVASHYPFMNAPGYYFMRMHQERSYLIALKGAGQVNGVYLDMDQQGYSFRNFKEYLLVGGAGHRTGENQKGGSYETLRKVAGQWYPGAEVEYEWSAQDCMTLDQIPYIGQYSASTPHVYVASGFNKWGMTSSMVSAMLLSDLLMGKTPDYAAVFSPQRFLPTVSMKNLWDDISHSVSGLWKEGFQAPKDAFENIPKGHGGIVAYDGEKVGVYRNQKDEVFLVSTQCPHLGCQLAWNPDDLTWECPCHGSRFDYRGNLLNTPAVKPLDTVL